MTQHSPSPPLVSARRVAPIVRRGTVYLVGAGPGASDLMTLRGYRILRAADVVFHDALIAPEVLAEANPFAQLISVGKRGYCVGSTRQETIHDALVRWAKLEKSVCRLKCGDPCIFGRGGEEAVHLAGAGVPFELVPGVTSAIGGCALAGIPLTHRDVGQSLALITAHHDPDSAECTHDWAALARLTTLVCYMGYRHRHRIAAKLLAAGKSGQTPVAILQAATMPHEQITITTLESLAVSTSEFVPDAPGLIVIGEVVRFREQLFPFASSLADCSQGVTA
ncbi:uroporphyrinogen-III C-methyltransferase [Tuwongella immobilis]|uniref:uroporphyrinogen-III C-methyltransferase n=1 Tax=Tuwongella immobilis TaxID=692036 RepID=A0A6C2YI87_9BACT|nr:uroporphyrinogen-III C-methyltransferase [Tuwongella immobilis]VIP00979.1 uroporphyrin-iii c-methyltransferase : Uroporphyrin-III C-methyltransferase OS=Bacillus methanolicus MGA3 GN=cobA PE=3 SV=1: TP_methylase [Tuwongella immobilis]VTR97376.1 uroporphyrin-iii c-methyltransferase : Uroporphyrin-III C-methyltransferase OS=Bacillus methanolicus MGA3 GN=cobA PE=3 SV=1: TP_methylase [Tuwongella immobilis]